MQKVIKAIKDCVASKTCCEEAGVDCNQGRYCPVREGTHKPAEAVHQIKEPTVNQQLTIEREAFEKWLGIKPCGAAHDFGWEAWKASAALATTKIKGDSLEQFNENKGLGVVLPEPDAVISEVMELVDALQFENVGIVKAVTPYELNTAHRNAQKARAAIESKLRALLATGGQAQAVEQAPVLYVSKGQLDNHRDPDGPDSANAGRYLPARITPAGNFTMPLFAAPQAQAEHIKALIEVSRMPNQEHVADAHNAAVRHLRAIAAAKGE